VNSATHQNGKIELRRFLGWDAKAQTCSGCHEREAWVGAGDEGDSHHEDDFALVDDAEAATGGCSSAGGSATLLALVGLGLLAARRRRVK
jgi:MYXO-CTERM domain-containing protein